jgi:DNA-binding NtrC family response regulator
MRALVVDDERLVRESLAKLLKGFEIHEIESLALFPGELKIERDSLDLVLLDLKSAHDPDAKITLARLESFKKVFPGAEVWVQSGSDDLQLMRQCIRAGAHRFILKEHLLAEIPLILETVGERAERRARISRLILGESPSARRLREELLNLSLTHLDVLVEGESGTGKELCAQALNDRIVAVNVAALPADLFEAELFGFEKGAFSGAHAAKEGLFESAGAGGLFLDEIQSLKPELQTKLLRVLETRKFRRLGSTRERDFEGRLICAANVSLSEKVARGEFREDLYHRIAPVTVRVPALRLRGADVSLLARHFLKEFDPRGTRRWDDEAMRFLETYEWPGNVRELRGLVRSLCARVSYPVFGLLEVREHLSRWENERVCAAPEASGESFEVKWEEGLDANIARLEEWMIRKTLQSHSGNETRERLGIKRSRFYEKLKIYGLLKE